MSDPKLYVPRPVMKHRDPVGHINFDTREITIPVPEPEAESDLHQLDFEIHEEIDVENSYISPAALEQAQPILENLKKRQQDEAADPEK